MQLLTYPPIQISATKLSLERMAGLELRGDHGLCCPGLGLGAPLNVSHRVSALSALSERKFQECDGKISLAPSWYLANQYSLLLSHTGNMTNTDRDGVNMIYLLLIESCQGKLLKGRVSKSVDNSFQRSLADPKNITYSLSN